MPPTVQGSRHRARKQIALRPGVYSVLKRYADKRRQHVRWALHDILLREFVQLGELTQQEADLLWDDLASRGQDADP